MDKNKKYYRIFLDYTDEKEESQMEIMYSTGGEGPPFCYVNICVYGITPATMYLRPSPGKVCPVPMLHLEYAADDIPVITAILTTMQENKENPEVYFWDLEQPAPEAVVLFRTNKPKESLFAKITDSSSNGLIEAARTLGCSMVLTTAEANLVKADVNDIIARCEKTQNQMVIYIHEQGAHLSGKPLMKFVTSDLRIGTRPSIF